jgi:hypothetical protein
MVKGEREGRKNHLPFRSAHFWSGLLVGLGVGLLIEAALLELELMTPQRKAWVSLLGALLAGVGGLVGRTGRSANQSGAVQETAPEPRGVS